MPFTTGKCCNALIIKAYSPYRQLVADGGFYVVGQDVGVGDVGNLGEALVVAAHLQHVQVVDEEVAVGFAVLHYVARRELANNERFAGCAYVHRRGGPGVQQVGVVDVDFVGLLHPFHALEVGVEQVYELGLVEVAQVGHYGVALEAGGGGELADVDLKGHAGAERGEQRLEFAGVAQVHLADARQLVVDYAVGHLLYGEVVVDGVVEVVGVVAEAQVVVEQGHGSPLAVHLLNEGHGVVQHLLERAHGHVYAPVEVEVLAEAQALNVVVHAAAGQVGVALGEAQQAAAAQHHAHGGVEVVDLLHLAAPAGVFVHLVEEEVAAAVEVELFGQLEQRVGVEVVVVARGVERLAVAWAVAALDVLQHHGGFAHALGPADGHQAGFPVDGVHPLAGDLRGGERQQAVVLSE